MRSFKSLILIICASFSLTGCVLNKQKIKNSPTENTINKEEKEHYIDISDDKTEPEGDEGTHPEGEVYLVSITITPPTRTVFEMGDPFDLTGLSIVGNYSNNEQKDVPLNEAELPTLNTYKLGEHTLYVKYLNKTDSFKVNVVRTYSEENDSTEGVNVSDLSELNNAFRVPLENYTSKTISYFNSLGAYDYYRHYQKNYVQAKNNILTSSSFYNYPYLEEYLGIMNSGYLNKNNNYYSFSLKGNTVSERLSCLLTNDDLTLVKNGSRYHDDLFTLADINSEYINNHSFTRISEHKYSTNNKSALDDFINICAPGLINEGSYMTFSKVTIETFVSSAIKMRIRLYASPTQTGKLIEDSLDQENKPSWYLLFSEALISDVGTTTFAPASSLLN